MDARTNWFRTLLSSSYAGILKNLILILLSFQTHVTIKKTSQAPWGSGAIFVTYYYPQFISIINVHKKLFILLSTILFSKENHIYHWIIKIIQIQLVLKNAFNAIITQAFILLISNKYVKKCFFYSLQYFLGFLFTNENHTYHWIIKII